MKSKTAILASLWALNRSRLRHSHSKVAKNDSHMALSKQSPTEPIEGRTPALTATLPEGKRGVLRALVRVMDHPIRPPAPHDEGRVVELTPELTKETEQVGVAPV